MTKYIIKSFVESEHPRSNIGQFTNKPGIWDDLTKLEPAKLKEFKDLFQNTAKDMDGEKWTQEQWRGYLLYNEVNKPFRTAVKNWFKTNNLKGYKLLQGWFTSKNDDLYALREFMNIAQDVNLPIYSYHGSLYDAYAKETANKTFTSRIPVIAQTIKDIRHLTYTMMDLMGLDTVTIYRGVSGNVAKKIAETDHAQLSGFSSYSLNKEVADNFARDHKGIVLKNEFNLARDSKYIVGYIGYLSPTKFKNEQEFIVNGDHGLTISKNNIL